MRKNYYGRDRRWRVGLCAFLIFLAAVFLVSCMAGSGVLFAGGVFLPESDRIPTEPTVRELGVDGVLAGRLCETVRGVVGNRLSLPTFYGEREANDTFREDLLFGMLASGYSSYVGNRDLIGRAEEAYPRTAFVILIPREDLEARAARYFGGGISHADAGAFRYLDRVGMYTTAAPLAARGITVKVRSLAETEHTYRMTFALTDGSESSPVYVAIFEKQDGGSFVWRALYEE